MELRPQESMKNVAYPVKKASMLYRSGQWIRRVGVAVAFTSLAAFGLSCNGDSMIMAGDIATPNYFCEDHAPEPAPDFSYPGTFSRELCSGQSTWMEMNIEEETNLLLELEDHSYYDSNTQAVIVDSEGVVAGVLGSDLTYLELTFSPGTWRVTVTQANDLAEIGSFSLSVEAVPAG